MNHRYIYLFLQIFIIEWILYKHCHGQDNRFEPVYQRTEINKRSFHPYVVALYCTIGPVALGTFTVGLLTDGAKFLVGRLRPHFVAACDPDFSNITCTDEYGHPIYVQDYTCLGTDEDKLKQMRSVVMFHQQSHSQGPPSLPLPLAGQLHPHFLAVCEPDFSNIRCTDEYGHPIMCRIIHV